LVTGINKMAHARALGMVDTTGDGVTDAVAYDTKGDGCVSARTNSDINAAGAFGAPRVNQLTRYYGVRACVGIYLCLDRNRVADAFDTTGDGGACSRLRPYRLPHRNSNVVSCWPAHALVALVCWG
jgi:hypothetical protein